MTENSADYSRPFDAYEEYIAKKRASEAPTLESTAVYPTSSRQSRFEWFIPSSNYGAGHNFLATLILLATCWFWLMAALLYCLWQDMTSGGYSDPTYMADGRRY